MPECPKRYAGQALTRDVIDIHVPNASGYSAAQALRQLLQNKIKLAGQQCPLTKSFASYVPHIPNIDNMYTLVYN